ncbi:MAG: branched-chain amino acid ABC transporter substrate-binding protein [Anaerolineales bacterium]|nr:branched-chain amino acid ABC transporter substrate-binding protein [Anaerolineales bacterium]
MNKRLFAILSVLILAAFALGACQPAAAPFECTDAIGCVDIAPGEPVHIAYMLTVTGATAPLGEDSKGAVEIAISDRGGELLGHKIEFTGEDSGCSAEGGQTAAAKVTSDPTVLGIIGTNCSGAAFAALPAVSAAGMLMISSSNTNPGLTDPTQGWEPGYYRTAHNDKFQGKIAAEFAYNELGARTAATIHDGSPYAQALQQVFADTFKELGGTITYQGAVNVGDTDMRTVLTTVAADSPNVLYFPIFEPEGPFIVAQSSEIAGLENTQLMGADGLFADTFPENAGPNVVGMYLSGPYVAGDKYDAFLKKWADQIGGVPPSGFHAFAYDASNILLDAIAAVAVQDADGTLHIGRQALRDYITNVKDFAGLTGTLSCGDKDGNKGDCATGQALGVFKITEAELNGNWPPTVTWTP